jgi:hypothetical protein
MCKLLAVKAHRCVSTFQKIDRSICDHALRSKANTDDTHIAWLLFSTSAKLTMHRYSVAALELPALLSCIGRYSAKRVTMLSRHHHRSCCNCI